MNILLISYLFPPALNPQSVLSARTAKYLKKIGHTVTVIAATNPTSYNSSHGEDQDLMRDLSQVEVFYVPDKDISGNFRNFKNKFIYHENYSTWVTEVSRLVTILSKQRKFDVIYSLCAPLASNMAGLAVKEQLGIPLVVHFSDPTISSYGVKFKSPLRTFLTYRDEKKIFKIADRVTFVNQESLIKCTEFDHQIRSKCFIVPHCFDPEYFTFRSDDKVGDVVDFSYIGSFYGRRNPLSLIKAFDLLLSENKLEEKIRLNFIGNISPEIIEKISLENRPWIKIYGPVTYMNSIKLMSQSNYLILVDMPDDSNLFTPSKLIDYLASKKPILGLTNSSSNSAKILKDLHCPIVEPIDVEGIKNVLKMCIQNKTFFSENEHLKKICEYDANKVVSSLVNILKGAI